MLGGWLNGRSLALSTKATRASWLRGSSAAAVGAVVGAALVGGDVATAVVGESDEVDAGLEVEHAATSAMSATATVADFILIEKR